MQFFMNCKNSDSIVVQAFHSYLMSSAIPLLDISLYSKTFFLLKTPFYLTLEGLLISTFKIFFWKCMSCYNNLLLGWFYYCDEEVTALLLPESAGCCFVPSWCYNHNMSKPTQLWSCCLLICLDLFQICLMHSFLFFTTVMLDAGSQPFVFYLCL